MRKPDNSKIDRSLFPYRLTNWMRLARLNSVVKQIQSYEGRECYGKYYIIKVDKTTGDYAVFTRGRYITVKPVLSSTLI